MTTANPLTDIAQALGGQYEVVRLLGRGGMASVYLAREPALERLVAIKVLPPELTAEENSRERFRREARTAANLSHPNIVPLHTFGEAEGMLYFVMGYVRGESLASRLRREGRLPADHVRRLLGELSGALAYAHSKGVIHRDVKPDNVLLDDETGRPMLTDFGIARAEASASTLTHAGTVVGTAHYMSPEQGAGDRAIDGRSDLYALGVMGYEMLSGRLPFEGGTLRDVLVQHAIREPIPLAAVAPDVPADLAAVVTRAMAKDPASRWHGGSEMALALGDDGGVVEEDEAVWQITIKGSSTFFLAMQATAATLAVAVATTQLPGRRGIWFIAPAVFSILTTIVLGGVAVLERVRRGSWSEVLERFMMPAPGWRYWWPSRWRRPGDVWDRLPSAVRKAKAIEIGAAVGFLPPVLVLFANAFGYIFSPDGLVPTQCLVSGLGLYLLFGGAEVKANRMWKRWGRSESLSPGELRRVSRAGLADREFWRKPRYAALLSTQQTAVAATSRAEPRAPKDFVAAIAEMGTELTGHMREVGAQSAVAARQLLEEIEALDREIETLARDADPKELAAVEQKLSVLGEPLANEPSSRRQVRDLAVGQAALLRRLHEQMLNAQERRVRLGDLLKTLWLQVANLRANAAAESLAVSQITQGIRALCDEIERHAAADVEIRALLKNAGD